jgi:hypothetical protein
MAVACLAAVAGGVVKGTCINPGCMTHIAKTLAAPPANVDAVYRYNNAAGNTIYLPGRPVEAAFTGSVIYERGAVDEVTDHVWVAKGVGCRVRTVLVVADSTLKIVGGGTGISIPAAL